MYCSQSPTAYHKFLAISGVAPYCIYCGQKSETRSFSGRRPRASANVRNEETAYQNWLSESEDGSYIDA